ncbi:MAG: single-stranded-DNA-specific exonuclease RecJ, partial [Blautia sp.]|nr:single-stranded-DNA-specific exonuclease RecJ [Blautia sp.]
VKTKRADFQKIAENFHIYPVLARIIRNRDIETMDAIDQYLNGGIEDLPSPWSMKGIAESVGILKQKLRSGASIRIIGDYDIDGVTATYILLKAFRRLNAKVDTYIPDRIRDGYGIHEHLIDQAIRDGIDTIVTCDNGISAIEEIKNAKEKGLTVIVTDHHEIPYQDSETGRTYLLPPADAIVNPKQPGCGYPNKNICGAVVAWKLVLALYEEFGIDQKEGMEFLEFAAIATVGDVMDLQDENRILVKEGLRILPQTENTGLQALIRTTGLENGRITAYHIGFVLGPCINASGRLDTASRALKLFVTDDPEEAAVLAGDLKALNDSRKALTEHGKEEAIRVVEETLIGQDRVLVIYLPDCHESLAGIIAGRIRELYHRPAFVLTRGETAVKGSGRSIEGYSMYEELVKCRYLLEAFGGHPMAAGLSLKEEQVEAFREKINACCTLTEEDLIPRISIDVPMPISYIRRELVRELNKLEPFGKGNEKPLFAQKDLCVIGGRILGKNQNVAKFQLMDTQGKTVDAVYFGEAGRFLHYAAEKKRISVTYYPEINTWQGRESVQVIVRNYC